MRSGPLGPVIRVVSIVAGLVLAGLVLKLIALALTILPTWLMDALSSGWALLYSLLPLAPICAIGILVALVWVVAARHR